MADELRSVPRVIHFGAFEVDPRPRELRRKGVRVALQDQPFSLLLTLLERPGELVTREELRHRLWPDDTFVDFEHGLNTAVKRLRDALGDSAGNPRFVETLPRRGYRFIAPLVHVDTTQPELGGPSHARPPRDGQAANVAHGHRSRQRPLVLVVASLLGVVLLGGLVERVVSPIGRHWGDEAVLSQGATGAHRVTVSAFENGTGRAALDPLGGLIAGRLMQALAQVTRVEVDSTLAQSVEARSREHARRPALVVTGAYYLHGDQLEVQVRLLDGATARVLHAIAESGIRPSAPLEGLDRLDDAVAGAVAMHVDEFFGGLGVVSRVPGLEAYNDYRAGLELFQSDYSRAVGHLDRATAASPGFLPAEVVLVFAHSNQQQHEQADALVARWDHSWDRLAPAERLLVESVKHMRTGRPVDALQSLRDLERLAPRSLLVQFNLGQQLRLTNQPRAAIEVFARMEFDERELRHSIGLYRHIELCSSLHMLGEYEEELQAARRAQAQDPAHPLLALGVVRALAGLGRVDEAIREADANRSTALRTHRVYEQAALELRAHGHRTAAVEIAQRAVEWQRTQPLESARTKADRWALARALYLAERWDEAHALFADLARDYPDEVMFTWRLGALAARLGDTETARAVSAELRQRPEPLAMLAAASIAALLNEPDEAVALLDEAFIRGLPYGSHVQHVELDLEPLRDHGRFLDLIRPKG